MRGRFASLLSLCATLACSPPANNAADRAPPAANAQAPATPATPAAMHYLEIVTPNVDATCSMYEAQHGLSFGEPIAVMGQARIAEQADGSLVGVRAPLAAHESAIVRVYLAVDDIQKAVATAETAGAVVAYPPTAQGEYGTFAIVIQDDVQHGLWQR